MDAVVLAAGKASRLGVPKFLLPAGSGHTLLTRVLETALKNIPGQVVVVLGRDAKLARENLRDWLGQQTHFKARVIIVENPNFEQGQSTSLITGTRAIQDSQGFMVFLADMPLLDKAKLANLVATIEHSPQLLAVAAGEEGQIRPPVYLSCGLFPEVFQLKGDQGARAILERHRSEIEVLEWGKGDWFSDIDTWEVYKQVALEQSWSSEPYMPLENPPTQENFSQWFSETRDHEDALDRFRRGVLGLLDD